MHVDGARARDLCGPPNRDLGGPSPRTCFSCSTGSASAGRAVRREPSRRLGQAAPPYVRHRRSGLPDVQRTPPRNRRGHRRRRRSRALPSALTRSVPTIWKHVARALPPFEPAASDNAERANILLGTLARMMTQRPVLNRPGFPGTPKVERMGSRAGRARAAAFGCFR